MSYAGYYFCRKAFWVAKEKLGKAHDWNPELLGVLGSIYLGAYAVGQFIAGASGTRWGPRRVLLVGMAVSLVSHAILGVANSFGTFAVFIALNGLAQATGWSNNIGTMGNWTSRSERGRIMGLWCTNFQVGGVLASGLAAFFLGTHYGFRWSFFSGSLVLLGVWVYFYFNQTNRPEDVGLQIADDDVQPSKERVAEVQPESGGWPRSLIVNVAIIGAFYFFLKFIRYSLLSWAPYLLKTSYGMKSDEAGYLSTVFEVAGTAGMVLCGWLSDRYFSSRRTSVALIFVLGVFASCGMLYGLGTQSLLLFTVAMGLIGFTLYGPDGLMSGAGAVDVGSAKRATMAAAAINGLGSAGSVVQDLLLGRLLKDGSVSGVFAVLLASSFCAVLCLVVLLVRNRRGSADV